MSKATLANTAIKLSKTPLGIIALFVLLAEAIATLVISTSNNLSDFNQTIIVLFITLFPVLVVIMFWHLIVKHNVKLYAPSEFRDQEHFVKVNEIKADKVFAKYRNDIILERKETKQFNGNNNVTYNSSHQMVDIATSYTLRKIEEPQSTIAAEGKRES